MNFAFESLRKNIKLAGGFSSQVEPEGSHLRLSRHGSNGSTSSISSDRSNQMVRVSFWMDYTPMLGTRGRERRPVLYVRAPHVRWLRSGVAKRRSQRAGSNATAACRVMARSETGCVRLWMVRRGGRRCRGLGLATGHRMKLLHVQTQSWTKTYRLTWRPSVCCDPLWVFVLFLCSLLFSILIGLFSQWKFTICHPWSVFF
jgi:hypothetical protein